MLCEKCLHNEVCYEEDKGEALTYCNDFMGWIPVSERLPKEDGLYLVYTEEQPFVCPFENGEFLIDDVLAWMPLPSCYEPQENEVQE